MSPRTSGPGPADLDSENVLQVGPANRKASFPSEIRILIHPHTASSRMSWSDRWMLTMSHSTVSILAALSYAAHEISYRNPRNPLWNPIEYHLESYVRCCGISCLLLAPRSPLPFCLALLGIAWLCSVLLSFAWLCLVLPGFA